MINLQRLKKMSWSLYLNAVAISVLSLMSIYTTTVERTMSFFYKGVIFVIIGSILYVVFSLIDYRKYFKYNIVIYVLNIIILLSVFLIGTRRLGAQRWIDLKIITIQPSEFSKIFIVLTLAAFLVTKYSNKNSTGISKIIRGLFHILIPVLLIIKQPDLGTTLIILFTFFIMIFVHGIDWRLIIKGGIAGIIASPIIYFYILKPYQRQRILTFLNPETDRLGSGWNITQSKIAIGSGGFYGKGFLNSTQSKLRFLPEAHTDFIGSAFLEETGLLGGIILLGLYLNLLLLIIDIGDKARDEYGKLVSFGICGIFLFHILINLGMIMGIMPVTGKPLLLMSYGGSSTIFSFIMLGIVQSIRVHKD